MDEFEDKLLKSPTHLASVNSLLYKHQFSEKFLEKTIEYYDSWICLKTQQNLTPAFCFQYLYDNDTDSADNWTDFNDILQYFLKKWPERPKHEVEQLLHEEHQRVLESKKSNMTNCRNV